MGLQPRATELSRSTGRVALTASAGITRSFAHEGAIGKAPQKQRRFKAVKLR
jgi:hypothetical protein